MPYTYSRGKRFKRRFTRRLPIAHGYSLYPRGGFRRNVRGIIRGMNQRVHNFVRTQETYIDCTDAAAATHHAGTSTQKYYTLDMLQNYTEFEALFDQYRILAVRQTFIWTSTGADQANTLVSASAMPLIGTVIDRDDDTLLTSKPDYHQYESFKLKRIEKPFSRYFHPMLAKAVFAGAFTAYSQTTNKTWVDMTSHDARYYGLKWYFDPVMYGAGENTIGRLTIQTKIYFQCRDVR